jgi:hypothetical protein
MTKNNHDPKWPGHFAVLLNILVPGIISTVVDTHTFGSGLRATIHMEETTFLHHKPMLHHDGAGMPTVIITERSMDTSSSQELTQLVPIPS